MGWPGEQLIIRLWDTLSEKGVGSLLKPGQMRREGLASIEVERAKMLVNAQTQREVEEIKSGSKDVSDFTMRLQFAKKLDGDAIITDRVEPTISLENAIQIGEFRLLSDAVRHEVNTAKTIVYAEEILREDTAIPPEDKIDEDWLYRWRDYTGEISSAELQLLWGRVLAGEVKAPGTYSLRCLDFLRNLSQAEAKLVETMCTLIVDTFIWKPRSGYELPLAFHNLLELEELGVVSGVGGSLSLNLSDENLSHPTWLNALTSNNKCLLVKHDNKSSVLNVPAYSVTKLGMQLAGLGSFQPDLEYLTAMAKSFIENGYTVSIADIVSKGSEQISWKGAVEIV
jgi:hypothetical protein